MTDHWHVVIREEDEEITFTWDERKNFYHGYAIGRDKTTNITDLIDVKFPYGTLSQPCNKPDCPYTRR